MITKIFIWLWWGVGLPCWLSSIFTNILGWIHLGDVKEFITLMLSVILGISQVVVMWAEKWDKIVARVKRIVGKKRKRRINP